VPGLAQVCSFEKACVVLVTGPGLALLNNTTRAAEAILRRPAGSGCITEPRPHSGASHCTCTRCYPRFPSARCWGVFAGGAIGRSHWSSLCPEAPCRVIMPVAFRGGRASCCLPRFSRSHARTSRQRQTVNSGSGVSAKWRIAGAEDQVESCSSSSNLKLD